MRSGKSSAASKRRTDLRNELWPQEPAWIADEEVGFFRAPRTLPLLLTLISSKKISGKKNAATVYLDLWARNWGEGIIEIIDEGDHAFAAGYATTRALRSWRERVHILEQAGFIKTKPIGNRAIGAVLLVHPRVAVERLRKKGLVPENWWNAYVARRASTGEEPKSDAATVPAQVSKVVSMKP